MIMNYFAKNKLITLILIAMLLGLLTGYLVNSSISEHRVVSEVSSANAQNELVKAALAKFDQANFSQQKKDVASRFSILSDIFLHLIKMIIAPLVLAVLVLGVAKVGDFKSVGRIGLKTLIYFTSATLIALALGLVVVNVFEPGKVMHLEMPSADQSSGIKTSSQSAKNFIDHVIPESIMRSMAAKRYIANCGVCIVFWRGHCRRWRSRQTYVNSI